MCPEIFEIIQTLDLILISSAYLLCFSCSYYISTTQLGFKIDKSEYSSLYKCSSSFHGYGVVSGLFSITLFYFLLDSSLIDESNYISVLIAAFLLGLGIMGVYKFSPFEIPGEDGKTKNISLQDFLSEYEKLIIERIKGDFRNYYINKIFKLEKALTNDEKDDIVNTLAQYGSLQTIEKNALDYIAQKTNNFSDIVKAFIQFYSLSSFNNYYKQTLDRKKREEKLRIKKLRLKKGIKGWHFWKKTPAE